MQDFLTNPGVQSALLPLLCALILAFPLLKMGERWLGIAILGGFLLTIALTAGLAFQPLTSTRKIILCSLFLPLSALILDWLRLKLTVQAGILMAMLALAAIWVVWPLLVRQEGMEAWLTGGRVALYAVGIGGGLFWFAQGKSHRESGAIIALGIGTGGSALLAASALYGQLAFAISAATGGLLLTLLFSKSPIQGLGKLSLFAAAIPLALIGGASTVYAQLPGMALLFLVLIPAFSAIPLIRQGNLFQRSAVSTILALLPAIPALWIAWKAAGEVGY